MRRLFAIVRGCSVAAVFLALNSHAQIGAVQRLDEGWEFHQGSLGSIWEIWRGDRATDNVKWTPVTLPHCFNARDAVDSDAHYYEGPGWYRTHLKLSNPYPQGRTLLHFEGAGQKSQVFVGLTKVGEHVGGYDEWTVDITPAETNADAEDELPVAVLCDNSRDAEMIPSDLSDFCRYGGLYRHVNLVYAPAISLAQIHITPVLAAGGNASVRIWSQLYNPLAATDDLQIKVEVRDPEGRLIQTATNLSAPWPEEKEIASFEIAAPKLWSPASPSLYHCSVSLQSARGGQILENNFGMRSVEWVEHGPFKLNGERLLLRGTQYHEDDVGVGAAVSDGGYRRTFEQIKAMGANFVRLAHYQQSPQVLDLCDQLGLLVWEEVPWCRGGLGSERYRQQCREMLTDLIDQHYNHPSVILWGMGNEIDWPGDFPAYSTNAIRQFMIQQNHLAHQLDPTRQTALRRCDCCRDIADVYSPSIWAGWYSGRYTEYRKAVEKAIADNQHFFHAEWGADSVAGRHAEQPERFLAGVATGQGTAETGSAYKSNGGAARASRDGDWSESYAINLFDWTLHEQETMGNLTGSAMWVFRDFPTPLRPDNAVPLLNQKGVVQRDGSPKESYYVFQSYWSDQPMIHIYGHTWPVRWGKPGELREVKVFSNCREVALFVNGVAAGVKRRNSADFPAAGLRWELPFNDGTNILRAVGRSDGLVVTDQISQIYQTASWSKPAELTLNEIAQTNGLVTIEARMFDQDGVPCLDAANVVRFGLTGDGRLLDDLGTETGSRVVQLCNGRAQISLQLDGKAAMASVGSEGFGTQFLSVSNATGSPAITKKHANGKARHTVKTSTRAIIDVAALDLARILKAADAALALDPVSITKFPAANSPGSPNDFYSNADYWWPDPASPTGLPYINRDGETNPRNFTAHRLALRDMSEAVAALGAAYKVTGDERYAQKAAVLLRVFFLDASTRMNPGLQYAQAIPGRYTGRSFGIIDGLHLIEVPQAIAAMDKSPALTPGMVAGLKKWFGSLADWMVSSQNGREEAAAKNNHAVAFWLQVACYARFNGDEVKLAECRRQFKEVFVPDQMAADGSFPLELKRTKPYAYSIFQLDNLATLCQVLSTPEDDLWNFELPDGRGIRKAVAYLYPFLADKSKWPLKPDIMAWDGWPSRQSNLLFAGLAFGERDYLELWKKLSPDPANLEVQRNIAITQPVLWVNNGPANVAAN